MKKVFRQLFFLGTAVLLSGVLTLAVSALELVDGKFSQPLDETIRCGRIRRIVVTTTPVPYMSLDSLLIAGKFNPDEVHAEAQTMRSPGAGKGFVILSCTVAEGLSIGKYDYVLEVGDGSSPAEAVGVAGEPFDPRRFEIQALQAPEDVQVIFEIALPASPSTAILRPKLNTIMAEAVVKLPIGREKKVVPELPSAPVDPPPEDLQGAGDGEKNSGLKDDPGTSPDDGKVEVAEPPVTAKKPKPEKKPVKKPENTAKKGEGASIDDVW